MKKIITILILAALLVTMAAVPAMAFTFTGDFIVRPTNNADFVKVDADPYSSINAGTQMCSALYGDWLPDLSFDMVLTIPENLVEHLQVSTNPEPITLLVYKEAVGNLEPLFEKVVAKEDISPEIVVIIPPDIMAKSGYYIAQALIPDVSGDAQFPIQIDRIPSGEVLVRKTDNQGRPLAGATIQMTTVPQRTTEAATDPVTYEAVTNASGIATFKVPEGVYTIRETRAPAGYRLDDSEYRLRVYYTENTHGFLMSLIDGEEETLVENPVVTFINIPGSFTVTANKRDENGAPLAGAALRMEGVNANDVARVYNATSNNNGTVTFSVEPGRYRLFEVSAPTGYNATSDSYDILVTEDAILNMTGITGNMNPPRYQPVTFVNHKIPELNKDDHFAYMQGYPEGTFDPSKNMTRAEAVVMFSRLLNESMNMTTNYRDNYYPDFSLDAWYANQVCYMHSLGVLEDYSRDERFRPNEPVTRAEFATLAAHFDDLEPADANVFPDVANDHWAVAYINSASVKGWILGYNDGTFRPEANITRAEVVTLVNRILERKADEAYITANRALLPRSYSDIAAGHWAYLDVMEASIGHDYVKDGSAERWTSVYQ